MASLPRAAACAGSSRKRQSTGHDPQSNFQRTLISTFPSPLAGEGAGEKGKRRQAPRQQPGGLSRLPVSLGAKPGFRGACSAPAERDQPNGRCAPCKRQSGTRNPWGYCVPLAANPCQTGVSSHRGVNFNRIFDQSRLTASKSLSQELCA